MVFDKLGEKVLVGDLVGGGVPAVWIFHFAWYLTTRRRPPWRLKAAPVTMASKRGSGAPIPPRLRGITVSDAFCGASKRSAWQGRRTPPLSSAAIAYPLRRPPCGSYELVFLN